jgi:hypothetical protein
MAKANPEKLPRSWWQCTEAQRVARRADLAGQIAALLGRVPDDQHAKVLAAAVQIADSPQHVRYGVATVAFGMVPLKGGA